MGVQFTEPEMLIEIEAVAVILKKSNRRVRGRC